MTTPSPIVELQNLRFAWPKQATLLDISEFRLESQQTLFLKGIIKIIGCFPY